jgi:mercuric ion transport protein
MRQAPDPNMKATSLPTPSTRGQGWLAGGGAAAALAGLLASSCCALPILMVSLGLGSVAGALVSVLAAWRLPMLGLAALLLAAAWWSYWRRRPACSSEQSCKPSSARWLPVGLAAASAVVLLALLWQTWIEPHALRWVR